MHLRYNVRMEDILNRHYATLLGLGEEWKVADVKLDVAARRIDIWLEYSKRSAKHPGRAIGRGAATRPNTALRFEGARGRPGTPPRKATTEIHAVECECTPRSAPHSTER